MFNANLIGRHIDQWYWFFDSRYWPSPRFDPLGCESSDRFFERITVASGNYSNAMTFRQYLQQVNSTDWPSYTGRPYHLFCRLNPSVRESHEWTEDKPHVNRFEDLPCPILCSKTKTVFSYLMRVERSIISRPQSVLFSEFRNITRCKAAGRTRRSY